MLPSSTGHRAVVDSFEALLRHPLRDGVNAVCWPRTLEGDFAEVAQLLAPPSGLTSVDAGMLRSLCLSPAGRVAANAMLEDLRTLDALGFQPELNCVASYEEDDRGLPISTDVMSFHVDRSPVEIETWVCTYWGKSSEGLDNGEATRLIDTPHIRAALLQQHGGNDDDTFDAFLREGSFDLHYGAMDGAQPFLFGTGHLWRIAVEWPGSPVPPCIHRAPRTQAGDAPRLLLLC